MKNSNDKQIKILSCMIWGTILFSIKWDKIHGFWWIIIAGIIIVMALSLWDNALMYISHILNNLFKLPHPGPKDIQGTCWCRRHEGKMEHSSVDYVI